MVLFFLGDSFIPFIPNGSVDSQELALVSVALLQALIARVGNTAARDQACVVLENYVSVSFSQYNRQS